MADQGGQPPFVHPRIRLLGDEARAKSHLGEGLNLLNKAKAAASTAGVPIFALSRKLTDGTAMRALVAGIDQRIEIDAPFTLLPTTKGEEPKKEELVSVYPGFVAFPRNTANPNGTTVVDGQTVSPDLLIQLSKKARFARFKKNTTEQAGTVTWIDKDDNLLSYNHGGPSRYHFPVNNIPYPKADIYYRGMTIKTPTNQGVMGVGIYEGRLIIVTRQISPIVAYECTVRSTTASIASLDAAVDAGQETLEPTWTTVGYVSLPTTSHYFVGWFFKPDGSEAQAIGYHSDRTFQRRKLTFSINATTGALEMTSASPTYTYSYLSPGWTLTSGSGAAGNYTINYTGDRRWLMVDYDLEGNEVIAEHVIVSASGSRTVTGEAAFVGAPELYSVNPVSGWGQWRGPQVNTSSIVVTVNRAEEFRVDGQTVFSAATNFSFTHKSIVEAPEALASGYVVDGAPPYGIVSNGVLTCKDDMTGSGTETAFQIQDLDLRFRRILMWKESRVFTPKNDSTLRGTYNYTGVNFPTFIENATTSGGHYLGYFDQGRGYKTTRYFGVGWDDFEFDTEPQVRDTAAPASVTSTYGATPLSITFRADPGGFSSAPPSVVFSCRSPKTFLSLLRVATTDGGEYHRLYADGRKISVDGKVPFLGTAGFNAYPVRTI